MIYVRWICLTSAFSNKWEGVFLDTKSRDIAARRHNAGLRVRSGKPRSRVACAAQASLVLRWLAFQSTACCIDVRPGILEKSLGYGRLDVKKRSGQLKKKQKAASYLKLKRRCTQCVDACIPYCQSIKCSTTIHHCPLKLNSCQPIYVETYHSFWI